MTCFSQVRDFRADRSRRAGFDHEWLHVFTFLCSLVEGSYFLLCHVTIDIGASSNAELVFTALSWFAGFSHFLI